MNGLGRTLIGVGVLLIAVGLAALLLDRMHLHLPLGRLPGDFAWHGRGWTVSFPLATCVVDRLR